MTNFIERCAPSARNPQLGTWVKLPSLETVEILALLRDLAREFGKTVVMVTHDPRGEAYVDEIHHLDKGVLRDSVAGGGARVEPSGPRPRAEAAP